VLLQVFLKNCTWLFTTPVRPVPEIAGAIVPYNLGSPAIQYNSINIHWLLLFLIFLESLHQDLLDDIKKVTKFHCFTSRKKDADARE